MYAVYQKAIETYIINKTKCGEITYKNGLPTLKDSGYIEHTDLTVRNLCIEYMFLIFGIKVSTAELHKTASNIENVGEKELGYMVTITRNSHVLDAHYLNNFPLFVKDNNNNWELGLLLFLIDPLEFIRRSTYAISISNDPYIKAFFLELERRIEDFSTVYVKFLLIMKVNMLDDIKRLVIEQYIDLATTYKDTVREYLMNGEKLKI